MTPKRHKLSVSIDEDYCVLGILSDEPDYKLAWILNDKLSTSFVKTDDLSIYNKKQDSQQEHSLFHFEDESAMLSYRIIRNASDSFYFLNDLKHIDFVLHIQGEVYEESLSKFVAEVNSIEQVRMCVPVDLEKLKERDRLLLW